MPAVAVKPTHVATAVHILYTLLNK